jgi:chemotaxis protein histidine kinase CheA
MNAPATIGHNSASPFTIARDTVNDAIEESRAWCDGQPVTSKEQADGLANLLDLLRKAHKGADEARKAEAKPFDDGKAEVQSRYKPLLTDADRAIDAVKAALTAWQREEQRKADEAARAAREAAQAAQREAEAARRAADLANLAEREEAERKLAEAERLARAADKAEAAPVGAKGAFAARRTSLVTIREPVALIDGYAVLCWAMRTVPDELTEWLLQAAKRHKGGDVPGVEYATRETVR